MKMFKTKATEEDYHKSRKWPYMEMKASEFPWKYPANETCLILKGSARVRDLDGNEIHFSEGDLVTFQKGLECIWKIEQDLSRKYIIH